MNVTGSKMANSKERRGYCWLVLKSLVPVISTTVYINNPGREQAMTQLKITGADLATTYTINKTTGVVSDLIC